MNRALAAISTSLQQQQRYYYRRFRMEKETANGGAKRPRAEAPRLFSIFQKRRKSSQVPPEQNRSTGDNTKDGDATAPREIFCDLDGVLVDFEAGVNQLRNAYDAKAKRQPPFRIWREIRQTPHFYRTLPWMADGTVLWAAIAPLQPHILTGVPWAQTAARDKFDWCQQELTLPPSCSWKWRNMVGTKKTHVRTNLHLPEANSMTTIATNTSDASSVPFSSVGTPARRPPSVVTCWSQNKPLECRSAGDILIDDRPENHDLRARWEQAGGIFIHHTSARETIRALVQLGVLSEDECKELKETGKVSEDVRVPESVVM
jgi:hypothetical protein